MSKDFDEDVLARMICQAGGDDRPSPEHRDRLRRQALESFDRAVASNQPTSAPARIRLVWRWIMSRPVPRYAASAALTIAILVTLWTLFGARQQVAFADLIQPILDAKTATFKMTTRLEGQSPSVSNVSTSGTRVRSEGPFGMIFIVDFSQGKVLDLDPAHKKATLVEMHNVPQKGMPASYLDQFRDMLRKAQDDADMALRELGEEQIDGQRALGYRIVATAEETYTLWIAPETRTLVRVEVASSYAPSREKTMSDFRFGVELDESLFSLTPPEGYEVRRLEQNMAPLTEEEFIASMGWASDALDGMFPDSLTMKEYNRVFNAAQRKRTKRATEKERQAEQELTRGFTFTHHLPPSADPHYAGKGVRRNEKDRPIFWYQPIDSDQFRVIYADLTVREANEAPDIPAAERIEASSKPDQ